MGHVDVGHHWDKVAMDLLDMSVTTSKGKLFFSMDGGLPTARYQSLGYHRHHFGYCYRHQEGCSVLGSGRCWFHSGFTSPAHVDSTAVGTICLRDDLPGGLCDCDDLPTNQSDHVDAEHVDDCFLQFRDQDTGSSNDGLANIEWSY